MQVRNSRGSSVWRTSVALRVALEPLRMRLHRVLPIQIRTHARDHVDAALLGGRAALAEEIAVAEKFAFAVERNLGLIERQDPRDAHQHGIDFQAGPIIRPLLDVEHRRIVLGHVGLADAADLALPGRVRIRGEQRRGQRGGGQHQEVASLQFHKASYLIAPNAAKQAFLCSTSTVPKPARRSRSSCHASGRGVSSFSIYAKTCSRYDGPFNASRYSP